MIFALALIPATMLSIAGYLAMYLSNRSEGTMRSVGKYLGFWACTLAVLVVLGGVIGAARGGAGMRARFRTVINTNGPQQPMLGLPEVSLQPGENGRTIVVQRGPAPVAVPGPVQGPPPARGQNGAPTNAPASSANTPPAR